MKNKIGLLGGTFNPVHKGHVELGIQIHRAFGLEKILYILSAYPPHKQNKAVADENLRWQMLVKVLEPYPFLQPCDIEMKRSTWSWTHDTIKELMTEYTQTDFYFISGSEGFLKIRTWKNYRRLLKILSFIVVLRKPEHRQTITQMLREEGILLQEFSPEQLKSHTTPLVTIFSYKSENLHLSSTMIREKIKSNQRIDKYVEKEVKNLMEEKKLYGH